MEGSFGEKQSRRDQERNCKMHSLMMFFDMEWSFFLHLLSTWVLSSNGVCFGFIVKRDVGERGK